MRAYIYGDKEMDMFMFLCGYKNVKTDNFISVSM
jgi:hypothetical protein